MTSIATLDQHTATHDLDLGVAVETATGAIIDFCYQCDDFVTRCRICAKSTSEQHTGQTRGAHHDHFARFGWSGMCIAPPIAHSCQPGEICECDG